MYMYACEVFHSRRLLCSAPPASCVITIIYPVPPTTHQRTLNGN